MFPVCVGLLYEGGQFPTPPHGRNQAINCKNTHANVQATQLRERDCGKAIGLLYTRVPGAYTGASSQLPVHPAWSRKQASERSKRTSNIVFLLFFFMGPF